MNTSDRNGKKLEDLIRTLYLEDEYLKKIPSLHEIDSPWKLRKLIPFINIFLRKIEADEINILDVGGGAGLILKGISSYVERNYNKTVNKFALDLSPEILKLQKKRNPDLKKALNEDIRETSFEDKSVDLTLMIDVLEHIPKPQRALEELKRISHYVLFKVPLANTLHYRILNIKLKGKRRQEDIEESGHVNFYNFSGLKHQIEFYMGSVLGYSFTNTFKFMLENPNYRNKMNYMDKIINLLAILIFKISPRITSALFNDFVIVLCKTY